MGTAIHSRCSEGGGAKLKPNSMARMKILVFSSLYPNNVWPNHGVFIKERMTQFAKLDGCELKVVAPVPYFPAVRLNWRWKFSQVGHREIRDGIEVYHPRYLLTPKAGMAFYGWMMFFSVLPVVKKIQRDFDFDLIDSHYVYPDGFAAVRLGRFFKKPVVVSARGSDINLFRTFPIIRKLLQYVLRKADKVVAVSQALNEAIVQLGIPEEKILTIPNGVDMKKFYPIPREIAQQELGVLNRKMILSVGNLTPNKGFDLLVRAFKILADEFHEEAVQLAIVGQGPYRSQLEKTIASLKLDGRVRLVGPVSHDKLRYWYCAADIFCLASRREGWPNVILESLACGTPVVATPVGGIPEILNSEKVGFLSERDESRIAETIAAALKKSWESDDIVAYARKHTWEYTALAVRQVFESVLNGNTARFAKLSAGRAVKKQSQFVP
jgi:teichuronic acid biosynthesis glycosyltransferase TuaC